MAMFGSSWAEYEGYSNSADLYILKKYILWLYHVDGVKVKKPIPEFSKEERSRLERLIKEIKGT